MVHLNYYGIQNKYLPILFCNSIAKLVYVYALHVLCLSHSPSQCVCAWCGWCVCSVCYKLIRIVCTGHVLFSPPHRMHETKKNHSFIYVVGEHFRVYLCTHSTLWVRLYSVGALSVCFPQTKYYELFKMGFLISFLCMFAFLHIFVARSLRPHQ